MGNIQRLPVNKFEWIEDTSQFKADFLKNYKNESEEEYFFEVDIQYPEKSHKLHNDLPYLTDKLNIEKSKSLLLIYMIKLNVSFT